MSNYGDGYQDALSEILVKWELEGPDGALAYIKANLVQPANPYPNDSPRRAMRRRQMTQGGLDR